MQRLDTAFGPLLMSTLWAMTQTIDGEERVMHVIADTQDQAVFIAETLGQSKVDAIEDMGPSIVSPTWQDATTGEVCDG